MTFPQLTIDAATHEVLIKGNDFAVGIINDARWPTGGLVVESASPSTIREWTRRFASALEEDGIPFSVVSSGGRATILPRLQVEPAGSSASLTALGEKQEAGLDAAGVPPTKSEQGHIHLTVEILRDTVFSQEQTKRWLQSVRSKQWLREHVDRQFTDVTESTKSRVSRAPGSHPDRPPLVVGVPFLAGTGTTLSNVITTVTTGLRRHYPEHRSIVLAVGESDAKEDVRQLAELSETAISHGSIIVVRKPTSLLRGKGWSVLLVLELAASIGAHVALLDADLVSDESSGAGLSPEWVRALLGPVVNGRDFVVPGYARHYQEARLTNPVLFPLVSSILGVDVRQPIGGDFGISARFADEYLRSIGDRRHGPVSSYGIDVSLTITAIRLEKAIVTAPLGVKLQDMSPVLGVDGLHKDISMFEQVIHALFEDIASFSGEARLTGMHHPRPVEAFGSSRGVVTIEDHGVDLDELSDLMERFTKGWLDYNRDYARVLSESQYNEYAALAESALEDLQISDELWASTVFRYLSTYVASASGEQEGQRRKRLISSLANLYCGYLVHYLSVIRTEKNRSGADDQVLSLGFVEEWMRRLQDEFVRQKMYFIEGIDSELIVK